jgi:hypothetical protein
MDCAFEGLIGKFMVDYQDDLTVHSKTRSDHIHHLRKFFDRGRLYGVSLNNKVTDLTRTMTSKQEL